ncbi:MAG: GTP-binding protein [Lachnospiraceae bacterium]|jgi:G3E family GTPase
MTKIDIISGFLGAGKTTLIKKLLQEAFQEEQVVLIENEFGEIGIDGGFLKDAGIEIREMNSGCICCSLVGDFGKALKEVVETYHPDRIVIEPSGVGKLSDVMKAVKDVEESVEVRLNSYTAVVDVKKCKMYMRNFGEFYDNQITYAGAIILSRTDLADEKKVQQCVEMIREKNAEAPIITTPIAQLDGKQIVEAMEHAHSMEEELLKEANEHHHEHGEECCCGHDHHDHDHEHHHDHEHDHDHEHHHEHDHDHEHHHDHEHEHEHHHDHEHEHEHHHDHDHEYHHDHHHHHADEVFTSWGKETIRTYTREKIAEILHTLETDESYGMILRAKGMVAGKDGQWIYFDMVPGEHEVREGAPEYTGRLCVIGSKIAEDKLEQLFNL